MKIIYQAYWISARTPLQSEETTVNYLDIKNRTAYKKLLLKGEMTAEDVARKNHEDGRQYCVTWLNDEYQVFATANLIRDAVSIQFIDAYNRVFMTLQFERLDSGERLLLSHCLVFSFTGYNVSPKNELSFQAYAQGDVIWKRRDNVEGVEIIRTNLHPVDIEPLYAAYPDFGDYDGLMKNSVIIKFLQTGGMEEGDYREEVSHFRDPQPEIIEPIVQKLDWLVVKRDLFAELYAPIFKENGFSKRGWEFYKELEKDKLAIAVKLTSSGNNMDDSVSFYVWIGLKFNPDYPAKLKKKDITVNICEAGFHITELLYPEETVALSEDWYRLGDGWKEIHEKYGLGPKIGDKKMDRHTFYGYQEGTGIVTSERISENYVKVTRQEFYKNGKLRKQEESIYRDIHNRFDCTDLDSIRKQLTEDIGKVIEFSNVLTDFKTFKSSDTRKIISDRLKAEIIERAGACPYYK